MTRAYSTVYQRIMGQFILYLTRRSKRRLRHDRGQYFYIPDRSDSRAERSPGRSTPWSWKGVGRFHSRMLPRTRSESPLDELPNAILYVIIYNVVVLIAEGSIVRRPRPCSTELGSVNDHPGSAGGLSAS